GWRVDDAHVYVDDAISGATFDRPALTALLATITPQPSFDVLIVADLDRLGREQWEMGYTLKRILMSGVRIFAYQPDREVLAPDAAAKFALTAQNLGNEMQ